MLKAIDSKSDIALIVAACRPNPNAPQSTWPVPKTVANCPNSPHERHCPEILACIDQFHKVVRGRYQQPEDWRQHASQQQISFRYQLPGAINVALARQGTDIGQKRITQRLAGQRSDKHDH